MNISTTTSNDQVEPCLQGIKPANELAGLGTAHDGVGSNALVRLEDKQKTKSFQNQFQKVQLDVIKGWRVRFPLLSDLLIHAERYPNVFRVLDRMSHHHLQPLLDQWQKDGRLNIEWPESLECSESQSHQ